MAGKIKENALLFIGIFFVLMFVLGTFGIINLDIIKGTVLGAAIPLSGGGMTVTSVSNNFGVVTNSSDIRNLNWMFDAILNGGSNSVVGTLTPTDVQSADLTNYTTKFPLTIKATSSSERINYSTTMSQESIYEYSVAKFDGGFLDSDETMFAKCPVNSIYRGVKSEYLLWKKAYCIVRTEVGTKSALNNPDVVFDAQIDLTANNETISKKITSSDTSAQFVSPSTGELRATVAWVGSLVTGKGTPNPNNYVAYYTKSVSAWKLADKKYWDNYNSAAVSTEVVFKSIPTKLDGWNFNLTFPTPLSGMMPFSLSNDSKNCNTTDECVAYFTDIISVVNLYKSSMLARNDPISDGAGTTYAANFAGTSPTTSSFSISIPTKITSPQLHFQVAANWLGIVIPEGAATIQTLDCPEYKKGITPIILTTINVTSGGSFYTTASCPGSSQVNTNQTQVQSGSATLRSNMTTYNSAATDSCTVRLMADTGKQLDSKTCTLKITQDIIPCNEGMTRQDAATQWICSGGQWVIGKQCASDEKLTFDTGTNAVVCAKLGGASVVQLTHKACVAGACAVVSGSGTDTCVTDLQCGQVPPICTTNPSDPSCITPPQKCEEKGWIWVEKATKTPNPWTLGLLSSESTESYCMQPADYTVPIVAVIAAITVIVMGFIFSRGPAKGVAHRVRKRAKKVVRLP